MHRFLIIASLALLTQAGIAQSAPHKGHLLNDAALDQVTAGGFSAGITNSGDVIFQGSVPTKNGLVSAAGSMAFLSGSTTGTNVGTLTLNGQAQQNLSSLVNINAVNSNIDVLLNLTVNLNSTIGTLTQTNLGGLNGLGGLGGLGGLSMPGKR